ncbi:hypothetical protein [Tatumella sp. JGM118]|nr:hypothetical protein [Tatumella sp. JGM118]MBS0909802.1 hypothetical protein [Tatumella sp. JGM118]
MPAKRKLPCIGDLPQGNSPGLIFPLTQTLYEPEIISFLCLASGMSS